jgi:hypothetical protein
MEKRRIIWRDYAAAFVAALECVNTEQSQDFATEFIPKALPFLTGEGDPPQQPCHPELAQAGSAWDDWCGEYRRKGNHPAGQKDSIASQLPILNLTRSPYISLCNTLFFVWKWCAMK